MNEDDLRAAMRATLTIDPPPPMESAGALTAGRRAVRRRTTLAGAGATAVLVAVTAVAAGPGLRLLSGGNDAPPWAGTAMPHPSAGEHTKPAWPLDGNGEPQEDATARSGARYEQGRRLLGEVLAVVPDGWTTPAGKSPEGIPLQDHQAQVEGDNTGSTWGYTARAAVAKDGRAGQLLAEVHTPGNGLPRDPCALANRFREGVTGCETVTVGRARVGVVTDRTGEAGLDQWAAYRHADGVVVYVAQGREATNGENTFKPLKTLPLTGQQLAALAVDDRFDLD